MPIHPLLRRSVAAAAFLLAACAPAPGGTAGPAPAVEAGGWARVSGWCGVAADGQGLCWQWGMSGELLPPAPIVTGERFRAVAGTPFQGCAVTSGGRMLCWGDPLMRAFGPAPPPPAARCGGLRPACALTPRPVAPELRFRSVSVGEAHACGVTEAGEAWCWGSAGSGRLGARGEADVCDPTGCYRRPVRAAASATFDTVVAGGAHSCALDRGGRAHCWGQGMVGQLGYAPPETCGGDGGAFPCGPVPRPVDGGWRWRALTAGGVHTCALDAAGRAFCWGGDVEGALGIAPGRDCYSEEVFAPCVVRPKPVVGGLVFRSLSAGGIHTCGVARDGAAYCWGEGRYGQLGQGSVETETPYGARATPQRVRGGVAFAEVSAGPGVCARTPGGAAYCWGVHLTPGPLALPAPVPDPPRGAEVMAFDVAPAPPGANASSASVAVEGGEVVVRGTERQGCRVSFFFPAVERRGGDAWVWLVQNRAGPGCEPGPPVAYRTALRLEPGEYRLRVVHHDAVRAEGAGGTVLEQRIIVPEREVR